MTQLAPRNTWGHSVAVPDPRTRTFPAPSRPTVSRVTTPEEGAVQVFRPLFGNDYILGCDPRRTQVVSADHQSIAGAYAPNDQIFLPVFGSKGEVHATDYFAIDDIYVLKDSLLTP